MKKLFVSKVLLCGIIFLSFAQQNVGDMPVSPGIYIEEVFPVPDSVINKLKQKYNFEGTDTIKACIIGRRVNIEEAGTTLPDTLFYVIADSIKNPHFQLYNSKGELVVKRKLKYKSNRIIINKKLSPGYYFYNILGDTYRSPTHRLPIKERKK